jgi:hypothetical protein
VTQGFLGFDPAPESFSHPGFDVDRATGNVKLLNQASQSDGYSVRSSAELMPAREVAWFIFGSSG